MIEHINADAFAAQTSTDSVNVGNIETKLGRAMVNRLDVRVRLTAGLGHQIDATQVKACQLPARFIDLVKER